MSPSAVFTTPELAGVGLTETKALAQGHAIDVYKSTFKPLLHTLGGRPVRTLMKLIVDAKTDKVLGCHIFGDHAAEIIQIVAVALKMGATKKDFDGTIALHPTAAEELVTMRTKSYSKTPGRSAASRTPGAQRPAAKNAAASAASHSAFMPSQGCKAAPATAPAASPSHSRK